MAKTIVFTIVMVKPNDGYSTGHVWIVKRSMRALGNMVVEWGSCWSSKGNKEKVWRLGKKEKSTMHACVCACMHACVYVSIFLSLFILGQYWHVADGHTDRHADDR